MPALERYDGPMYQSLRKFLRGNQWPQTVSIAVLSAKHGLFGILKGIENYDVRMDSATAAERAPGCAKILEEWARNHDVFHLSLGKDYLPAVQPALAALKVKQRVLPGPIGLKRSQVTSLLNQAAVGRRRKVDVAGGTGRIRYFLPDWDDLLDPKFEFEEDSFSELRGRSPGSRKHCCLLMRPKRMCDGILVSLAQQGTTKGPLRRLRGTEQGALSPVPLRKHFGLSSTQFLFGDCGAFSYVNEDQPTIRVEQAVALYDLYGFDFGASVDHIPVRKIELKGKARSLSKEERENRIRITQENAKAFLDATKKRKANFNPVGTIQALSPEQYAQAIRDYHAMGYRHMAIGGLVPLKDGEIERIARAVAAAAAELKERPWIHLFGIFRPRLQDLFGSLKFDSFDSATYFRKAWLRSDQNYLGRHNGEWYSAVRVPMTSDGRTRQRLISSNADIAELERQEAEVISLLCKYDREECNLSEVLDAVLSYDHNLARCSETGPLKNRYRRTLEDRPWMRCDCPFCREAGIHVLIFRGANRNKRRGAHNTLMLYGSLSRKRQNGRAV